MGEIATFVFSLQWWQILLSSHLKVFEPLSLGIKPPLRRSNAPNAEDTLQWAKIRGEWFTVPEQILRAQPVS